MIIASRWPERRGDQVAIVKQAGIIEGGPAGDEMFFLDSFMAGQSAGLYYDFTKTDRLLQENVGPTPADNVGEVIGLALDQRQWGNQTLAQVVAGQSELLVPGSWTMENEGGSSASSENPAGTLNLTGDGVNSGIGSQAIATVIGAIYRLEFFTVGTVSFVRVGTAKGGTQNLSVTNPASGAAVAYYFTATAATTWVQFRKLTAVAITVSAISCKLVPGIPALQATGSLKPTFQTTGAKFDGTDDNLLTSYVAGGGANFIVVLVTVPADVSASPIIVGSRTTVDTRFYLGFRTTGQIGGGVGSQNVTVINGGNDLRSSEVVVGISNGSGVRLFSDAQLAYEGEQVGVVQTSIPFRVGAFNENGAASLFFAGSIKKLVAGREFITLGRYLQIRNALLAA